MIRILTLRIIISWWFIPIFIIFYMPIAYLISGDMGFIEELYKNLIKTFWYGR